MHWFFAAMDDPRLKPMIFSKGILDKQAEFGDDFGAWMKWLRDTFEESDRKSHGADQPRNESRPCARRRRVAGVRAPDATLKST